MRVLILITVIIVAATATARSQINDLANDPDQTNMCWTPEQQRGTAGEISPRVGARGARVPPPRRTLAPFAAISSQPRGVIRRVTLPDGKKLVALTFDLCEAAYEIAGYDGRIVDYLRENGIKATFFAGGKWLLTHNERAQQLLADPLFEVANHGWRHADFKSISGQKLREEAAFSQAAYEEIRAQLVKRQCRVDANTAKPQLPERMTLLRFPYGTCNARALEAVAEAGLLAIQWDVATGDPSPGRSARAIASRVMRSARPDSIILGHANGRGWNTAAALPIFVPVLKKKGYRFVTVSELLEVGTPEIVSRCYDQFVGDTERWTPAGRRLQYARRRSGRAKRTGSDWNPFLQ